MTIPDRAVENLLVLWIFAAVWMAASVFIVTPMVRDALQQHHPAQLSALVFPAIGLVLLVWALRRTLRLRKFGRSVLRLTGPAMPGGDLAATIVVDHPPDGGRPMRLRLRCIQRWRPNARRTRSSEKVLWQQSQKASQEPGEPNRPGIAVRFHLPADARATTSFDGSGEILWQLDARGPFGLVPYSACFEIPVGSVAVQAVELEPDSPEPAPDRTAPVSRPQRPEPGVTCEPLGDGGLRIRLAAARRKPVVPTVAGLILTGIAAGLFLAPAPGVMRIATIAFGSVFLLPGAVFDYIAIYLWFVRQELTVRRGSLEVERRVGGFRTRQTFELGDIAEITCKIDGTSSSGGSGVTTFHGIQLQTRDGRSVWLASELSRADYAGWLAEEIKGALGQIPRG